MGFEDTIVRGLCFHPACAPVALCWACEWACAIGLMSRSQRRCALHSAPATRLAQAQTPLPRPAAAAGPSRRTRCGSLLTRWRRRSACSASWRQRRLLLLVATQRRSSWRGSWRRSNRRWVRRGAARRFFSRVSRSSYIMSVAECRRGLWWGKSAGCMGATSVGGGACMELTGGSALHLSNVSLPPLFWRSPHAHPTCPLSLLLL